MDAATRTTVVVSSSAYHEDDCGSLGCSADLTRDSDSEDDASRWSCHYDLKDKNCKLWYRFGEPQYLDSVELAFFRGDQRTRSFKVKTFDSDNRRRTTKFTSSGETDGFESFEIATDDVKKLYIQPIAPDKDEWISVKEVSQPVSKSLVVVQTGPLSQLLTIFESRCTIIVGCTSALKYIPQMLPIPKADSNCPAAA